MELMPGAFAYIDIMASSTGSIIPQMTGFLRKSKYFYIYFFVDNASNYTFTYYTKWTDVSDILDAKRAYEREIYKYSIEIKHIHTDNSTYAYKGYKDAVYNWKQSLTFYSVGTQIQNRKAENRIKIVIPVVRIALINAMYK